MEKHHVGLYPAINGKGFTYIMSVGIGMQCFRIGVMAMFFNLSCSSKKIPLIGHATVHYVFM